MLLTARRRGAGAEATAACEWDGAAVLVLQAFSVVTQQTRRP